MNTSVMRAGLIICLVLAWLLLTTPAALAHKVTIFAWVETGQVHTESKFSGGKRVKGGRIEVFDHQGAKVLEGTTDERGYFAFPVPAKAKELKIILKAGMGHGNQWTVTAQELGAAIPNSIGEAPAQTADTTMPPSSAGPKALDTDTLERIVEKALDKKLAPLKARLADQAWGLRDILGGLGYILGLVGLAAFLKYRKQQTPKS